MTAHGFVWTNPCPNFSCDVFCCLTSSWCKTTLLEATTMKKLSKTRFLLDIAIAVALATSSSPMYGQGTSGRPTGLLRAKKPIPNHYIVVLKDPGANDPKPDIEA